MTHYAVVGLALAAQPMVPQPPVRPLIGPLLVHNEGEQLHRDLVSRSLARNRQMLAMVEGFRATVEQWQRDGDPRFEPQLLERYKRLEEDMRSRVAQLERGRLP